MKFRTEFKRPIPTFHIGPEDHLLFVGSCFTENIGRRLLEGGFQGWINPHGISFNPMAICRSLQDVIDNSRYSKEDLIQHGELFQSLNHHSRFSHTDAELCLNGINSSIEEVHQAIKTVDHLFVSPGTAWVYEFNETGKIANNCHRIDQKEFTKRLLTQKEIVEALTSVILNLQAINPKINICLSVSPVRHLKDGMIENTKSKSTLHLALHEIIGRFPQVSYFPSYELLMDDLRDYRFYNSDLLHPSNEAVDYIYACFQEDYLNDESKAMTGAVNKIKQALNHKPRFENTASHEQFIERLRLDIQEIKERYPHLNFGENID